VTGLQVHVLNAEENQALATVARAVLEGAAADGANPHPFDRGTALQAAAASRDLVPPTLRNEFATFAHGAGPAFLLVRGLHDDDAIGPTPAHWRDKATDTAAQRMEAKQFALCSLIGTPLALSTCQAGHMVQEVVPIAGYEKQLFGNSSDTVLYWHTEDAFLDGPARWLHLACVRNLEQVPTRLSAPDLDALPEDVLDVLGQPRFGFLPDVSHMIVPQGAKDDAAQQGMAAVNAKPTPSPLVTASKGHRKLLYDEPYLADLSHDPEAKVAFGVLKDAIDSAAFDLVLQPGDLLFIDNHRAVHARGRWKARYDGQDRWLKRIYIAAPDFPHAARPDLYLFGQ
jgi:hypothetical protein